MRTLLMHPHIIAQIFEYYGTNKYDYITVCSDILGRVDNDEELTARIIEAGKLCHNNILRKMAPRIKNFTLLHVMAAAGIKVINYNMPLLDDQTARLISYQFRYTYMSCGDKWFRAKLAPSRFERGKLESMVVKNWDADIYVPELKELYITGDISAPLPRGIKKLRISYKHANLELPKTLKKIEIVNPPFTVAWWPGIETLTNDLCKGASPNRGDIKLIKADDICEVIKNNPEMLASIKSIEYSENIFHLKISSVVPGGIMPPTSITSVDFRNITNKTVYYIYVNIWSLTINKIYLPVHHSLIELHIRSHGNIICGAPMPELKYAELGCEHHWHEIKAFAPNIKILSTCWESQKILESASIMELILESSSIMPRLNCPKLMKVVDLTWGKVFNLEGWHQICSSPPTYLRHAQTPPPTLPFDVSYSNETINYDLISEDEYARQYSKFKRAGLIISESAEK